MSDADPPDHESDPEVAKTILLVEDDADIREALVAFLGDATAYQVIDVPDGFAALKVVRTLIPHLILLDYLLPNMDGLECLTHLRATKGVEQTPVILMTASLFRRASLPADLLLLEKPFSFEDLLVRIRQLLEEHHADLW